MGVGATTGWSSTFWNTSPKASAARRVFKMAGTYCGESSERWGIPWKPYGALFGEECESSHLAKKISGLPCRKDRTMPRWSFCRRRLCRSCGHADDAHAFFVPELPSRRPGGQRPRRRPRQPARGPDPLLRPALSPGARAQFPDTAKPLSRGQPALAQNRSQPMSAAAPATVVP
jgi:hypothetical protein